MVTVVPADEGWGQTFSNFGKGLTEGYMNRSDQKALQKAVDELGPDADPRDVLKAVTGVHTYDNKAKQDFLKNSLEVEKYRQHYDETKKKHEIQEAKVKEKEAKRAAEEKKAQNDREVADTLIEGANIPAQQKAALKGKIGTNTAAALATKNADTSEYEIAKNQAKRFEQEIDHYNKKAFEEEQTIPVLESTILNNEKYNGIGKYWDTALDAIDSKFLNPLKTLTGQQLEAYIPTSIASFSSGMGGVITNARQKLIEKKALGLGRDIEANRMVLYMDLYKKRIDILRNKIANDIISESKYGLPPKDFHRMIEKKLLPYQKMVNEDIGQLLQGKKPTSEMSQLSIEKQYKDELQPGEVLAIGPDGKAWAFTEEELKLPEYKNYKRL